MGKVESRSTTEICERQTSSDRRFNTCTTL